MARDSNTHPIDNDDNKRGIWIVDVARSWALMRDMRAPFRFDIAGIPARFCSLPIGTEATATIRLPGLKPAGKGNLRFLSFEVTINRDQETPPRRLAS